MPSPNERVIIREVWAENLDQEMALLRDLVDQYPYLAMVCYPVTTRRETLHDLSEPSLMKQRA